MSGGIDPALALATRLCLAVLFAGAAWHKLRAPGDFRAALAGFGVLPARAVRPVAGLLVAAEAIVVAALLVRPAVGGAAAAALLVVYAAAMALALARGRGGVDCGCGGPAGSRPIGAGLVLRNLILVAATLPLVTAGGGRPLGWLDGITVAGTVAAGAALFAAANQLLATSPRIRALGRAGEGA